MKTQIISFFIAICLIFTIHINAHSASLFRADLCNLTYYPAVNTPQYSSQIDFNLFYLGFEKYFYEFGIDVVDLTYLFSFNMTNIDANGNSTASKYLLEQQSYLPFSCRVYLFNIIKRPYSISLSAFGKYNWLEDFNIWNSFESITFFGAPRFDYGITFDASCNIVSLRLNMGSSYYSTNDAFSNYATTVAFPHSTWSTPFTLSTSFLIDFNLIHNRIKRGIFSNPNVYYFDVDKSKLITDKTKFIKAVIRKDSVIANRTLNAFNLFNGSPIMYAIKTKDTTMLTNLLIMGYNPNAEETLQDSNSSITPLMFCINKNEYKMAEILLTHDANAAPVFETFSTQYIAKHYPFLLVNLLRNKPANLQDVFSYGKQYCIRSITDSIRVMRIVDSLTNILTDTLWIHSESSLQGNLPQPNSAELGKSANELQYLYAALLLYKLHRSNNLCFSNVIASLLPYIRAVNPQVIWRDKQEIKTKIDYGDGCCFRPANGGNECIYVPREERQCVRIHGYQSHSPNLELIDTEIVHFHSADYHKYSLDTTIKSKVYNTDFVDLDVKIPDLLMKMENKQNYSKANIYELRSHFKYDSILVYNHIESKKYSSCLGIPGEEGEIESNITVYYKLSIIDVLSDSNNFY